MSAISNQQPTISEDKEIEQGVVYSFTYSEKYQIAKKHQNLKLYVALVVDVPDRSNEKRIKLPPKPLRSLRGPISSETIRTNGTSNMRSSIFVKQDGSVYTGPVHQHKGGFMEGSYHKAEPHGALTRQTVYNIKIKDYKKQHKTEGRERKKKERKNMKIY